MLEPEKKMQSGEHARAAEARAGKTTRDRAVHKTCVLAPGVNRGYQA